MEKDCKSCKHWVPTYHGVGKCVQEGLPNAKFWVTKASEGSVLLTVSSFSCQSHQPKEDERKEII